MESIGDPVTFFRLYQAGITVTPQDPVFSVCNCQETGNGQPLACISLQLLKPCGNESSDCTLYSGLMAEDCPADAPSAPNLCDRTDEDCYNVDAFSADLLKVR